MVIKQQNTFDQFIVGLICEYTEIHQVSKRILLVAPLNNDSQSIHQIDVATHTTIVIGNCSENACINLPAQLVFGDHHHSEEWFSLQVTRQQLSQQNITPLCKLQSHKNTCLFSGFMVVEGMPCSFIDSETNISLHIPGVSRVWDDFSK